MTSPPPFSINGEGGLHFRGHVLGGARYLGQKTQPQPLFAAALDEFRTELRQLDKYNMVAVQNLIRVFFMHQSVIMIGLGYIFFEYIIDDD